MQEAEGKWPALKTEFPDTGAPDRPLQSNKAKQAVALFDVIETVDRDKIAAELAREIARQGKAITLLCRGEHGFPEHQRPALSRPGGLRCSTTLRDDAQAGDQGLMCIPPLEEEDPGLAFALPEKLARQAGVILLYGHVGRLRNGDRLRGDERRDRLGDLSGHARRWRRQRPASRQRSTASTVRRDNRGKSRFMTA